MDVRLDDKVAIVTGSSSGIGKSIALRLAEAGAAVCVVADRNVDGGKDTVARIAGTGGQALFVQADVSVADDCARIVSETVAAFGGVDVLVNNAGITRRVPLEEMDEQLWDRVLDTNLKSVYMLSRQAVAWMLEAGSGSVINIGSVHGSATHGGFGAYAASKAGMCGLTRALACEFGGRRIRFNCIQPGTIDVSRHSPDSQAALDDWQPAASRRQVTKRLGDPDEIANVVCFLASEQATYVSGATLAVDGALLSVLADD